MKKSTRLLKKVAALFLVVLMSIESFAAVVSDNDGAAFISQAEFDSLNHSFTAQIYEYNRNLDNKISDAISTYIAGAKERRVSTNFVINKDWEEVSSVSGVFPTEWKMPKVNLGYTLTYGYISTSSYRPRDVWSWTSWNLKYVQSRSFSNINPTWINGNESNKRNIVEIVGSFNSPTRVIWSGQAYSAIETWKIIRTMYNWTRLGITPSAKQWDAAWLDRPDVATFALELENFWKLTCNGALNVSDNMSSIWPFNCKWKYNDQGRAGTGTYSYQIADAVRLNAIDTPSFAIELGKDSEGKQMYYKHIIGYDKNSAWRVGTTLNTFAYQSSESALDTDDIAASGELVASDLAVVHGENVNNNGSKREANVFKATFSSIHGAYNIDTDYTKTEANKFPNIGMLKDKYTNANIYQDNVTSNIDVATGQIEKTPPTLNDGLQLLAGVKDAQVTWEPIFNYTHVHNGTSTYTDNNHEVDIYFSSTPFTDKVTSSNIIRVKVGNDDTLKDYAITTNRKCTIRFTLPRTGIVYVKWVPHNVSSTYLNSDWIVTLDLKNCNSYQYTI